MELPGLKMIRIWPHPHPHTHPPRRSIHKPQLKSLEHCLDVFYVGIRVYGFYIEISTMHIYPLCITGGAWCTLVDQDVSV